MAMRCPAYLRLSFLHSEKPPRTSRRISRVEFPRREKSLPLGASSGSEPHSRLRPGRCPEPADVGSPNNSGGTQVGIERYYPFSPPISMRCVGLSERRRKRTIIRAPSSGPFFIIVFTVEYRMGLDQILAPIIFRQ
jgi:hypothetical protein